MSELYWARMTMALSLGFHIIFASISMVLPFYMALSHRRYLKTGSDTDLRLTKAWSYGAAVLFATGAVSGTALSFQLGLLWPGFMEHAGPIIGMPFSLEGAAFFLEAIFLGLFLYGWNRLEPRAHFAAGLMVGVCGLASGVLVIAANGFMNAPTGFEWVDGRATNIDPWKAMFNRAWPLQAMHMLVAAAQATGCAVAGIHAFGMLRSVPKSLEKALHQRALSIVVPLTVVASLVQPLLGDFSAKAIARRQPEKLAAMEAHFETEAGAGLWLGGIVDEKSQTVRYGVQVPKLLSILAHGDPNARVLGLNEFPPAERPPVGIVHIAFQVMVAVGTLLAALSTVWLFARKKRPLWLEKDRYFQVLLLLTPLGFLALEAGWIVTEVGRQPWVMYRIMTTAQAVTPVAGLEITFFVVLSLYAVLGCSSFFILHKIYRHEMALLAQAPSPMPATHPDAAWGQA